MKQHCHGQYEEIRKPGDMEVGDGINVPESSELTITVCMAISNDS